MSKAPGPAAAMVLSVFTSGVRNLFRKKYYFGILTTGMAIGIACLGIIIKFILFETGYDSFHANADDIYRVTGTDWATTPAALGPGLKQFFSEVRDFTRIAKPGKVMMKAEDIVYYQDGIMFTEPSFFSLFSFKILKGQPASALNEPGKVYLTTTTAMKYFGGADPIGRVITYDGRHNLLVIGIVQDAPLNSQLKYEMLVSLCTMRLTAGADFLENNMNTTVYTYIMLNRNSGAGNITARMQDFYSRYFGAEFYDFLSKNFKEAVKYQVQPLRAVHLNSNLAAEPDASGSVKSVMILSCLAVLIMIIACINYINLSTARAFTRLKEAGVRKLLGGGKSAILLQFMGESVMLACLAWPLSLLIISAATPMLKNMLNHNEFLDYGGFPYHLLLIGVVLITGIISGASPAMLLARANPIQVLSGYRLAGVKHKLKNVLMAFQFSVSVVLMAAAIIIAAQTGFMKGRHLNYQGEQILVLPLRDSVVKSGLQVFKEELKKINGVLGSAGSSDIPGEAGVVTSFRWQGMKNFNDNTIAFIAVDREFIETYKIKVIKGRNFSADYPADQDQGYIINKAAFARLGYSDALNQPLQLMYRPRAGSIIGIVEDFSFKPAREKIEPLVLFLEESRLAYVSIRINSNEITDVMPAVKAKWKEVYPDRPFEYAFLDEHYNKLYQSEIASGYLVLLFAVLAVIISCMGFAGLVSLSIENRTKEIGIRRALGAGAADIVYMMSAGYFVWIGSAAVLALPAVLWLMSLWLMQFPIHIAISFWMYLLPVAILFVSAGLIVIVQGIRAALQDPVQSLRYE